MFYFQLCYILQFHLFLVVGVILYLVAGDYRVFGPSSLIQFQGKQPHCHQFHGIILSFFLLAFVHCQLFFCCMHCNHLIMPFFFSGFWKGCNNQACSNIPLSGLLFSIHSSVRQKRPLSPSLCLLFLLGLRSPTCTLLSAVIPWPSLLTS